MGGCIVDGDDHVTGVHQRGEAVEIIVIVDGGDGYHLDFALRLESGDFS